MNIGLKLGQSERVIPVFTWVWALGSIVASAYFAFWLFPSVYDARTSAQVELHFQTKNPGKNNPQGTWYFPNRKTYKDTYMSYIDDKTFLYYSACELLPISQRTICDTSRNWKKLDPRDVGCSEVKSCNAYMHRLSEEERYSTITGATPVQGATFNLKDMPSLSLSDPAGWGKSAALPIFFISLFLSLKLGRAMGEFAFKPYNE